MLVLALRAAAGGEEPAGPPPSVATGGTTAAAIEPFLGHYRYAGGAAEIAALDAAIAEVVTRMNFLIRGIARRRIRAPSLPGQELILRLDGAALTVVRPGQPTVSAPADGTPIEWTSPDGDHLRVSHGIAAGGLYQRFEGARSRSENQLRLSADGTTLTVDTRVESRHLPAPLSYRFTYERR